MPRTLKQVAIDMANAFTRWQLWQGGGSSTLSDLTDVELIDLQADDVLQYDGNKWINSIMQGGGSVGAKIDFITQITVLPIPIDFNKYDKYMYICTNNENTAIGGNLELPKNELPKLLVIPYSDSSRIIITNGNQITENAVNGKVFLYGIKFAPIEQNLHEYTTEEKVIGKWIDGKNLYEQTFSMNLSVGTTTKQISNIDKLINYFGSANIGGSYRPIPFNQNGNTSKLNINEVYNGQLYIVSAWSAYVEMTIQYTKTTD